MKILQKIFFVIVASFVCFFALTQVTGVKAASTPQAECEANQGNFEWCADGGKQYGTVGTCCPENWKCNVVEGLDNDYCVPGPVTPGVNNCAVECRANACGAGYTDAAGCSGSGPNFGCTINQACCRPDSCSPAPEPVCTTSCENISECKQAGNCSGGTQGDSCGLDSKGRMRYICDYRSCTTVCPPTAPPQSPTPIPTDTPTPVPPTPTPEIFRCQNMRVFVGSIEVTQNLGTIKFGDTVNYTAYASPTSKPIKSITFRLSVGGVAVETKEVPAVLSNGVWAASYIKKVDSYGVYNVLVTAVTPVL